MTRLRLLAITPPTGPVPGDILLRWLTPARSEAPDLAVLLVFAPGAMRYGDLKPYLSAVLATHPNLYVFVE